MADPVLHVRDALASGELGFEDLTARRLGGFLGKTTSVLYHHWGSLDGFLFAVSQAGMALLYDRLEVSLAARGSLADVAAAFVAFGLESPALYSLMFVHRFDWGALRRSGAMDEPMPGLRIWNTLVERMRAAGHADPEDDARLLYAALHGLVSLASSGRVNIGALADTERDVAMASARRLVAQLTPVR
ncbi:MAG: TetR-like C-terminal domain-containing protein [Myxococcota bacterium]